MRSILLVALIFFPQIARAQQIAPVINEFHIKAGKPIHGFLDVRNVSATPLVVTVEPMSFDHAHGALELVPLDKSISIRLGETSFQLPPNGSRTVYWDAHCQTLPCYFQIFSTLVSGVHVENGVQVAVHIPSVVYVCDSRQKSQKNCRNYVRHVIFGEQDAEVKDAPAVPTPAVPTPAVPAAKDHL
jgi:hypothetical protein